MVLLDPSDFEGFMEHGPPALAALETATDIITSIKVTVRDDRGITIVVPAGDNALVYLISADGDVDGQAEVRP